MARIKIDEENLWWVCDALYQASKGTGNIYRRWGRKIQEYVYRVYQNYNTYGRFTLIKARLGDRNSAVIIPENTNNRGWSDIAGKILRFLDKSYKTVSHQKVSPNQSKSYADAASIPHWRLWRNIPEATMSASPNFEDDNSQFLKRCLVGTFNDPFDHNPNLEAIQKWFLNRWKVCAGIKVSPLSHNWFLLELPSRQEAARVKVGEWFWNGRKLTLDWWSPMMGTKTASPASYMSGSKFLGSLFTLGPWKHSDLLAIYVGVLLASMKIQNIDVAFLGQGSVSEVQRSGSQLLLI